MLKYKVSPAQVELLMKSRGVNKDTAIDAIAIRDGILEFAEEYIDFRDKPEAMDFEKRFPKWSQYLDMKRRA